MDAQKLIDYIPAVLILLCVMTISLVIIVKFGDKIFEKDFKADNVLLYLASFLFLTLLIVHLFKPQSWTEDTLEVLIGVLVGAGASKTVQSMRLSGNKNKGIINQALRDINQKIEHLNTELSQFENAIVNQSNGTIKPVITKTERMSLETEDPSLLSRLRDIQSSRGDDWTWRWREECLNYPEFHKELTSKIENLKGDGWKVTSMNLDNTQKGIHINMELEKPFI